MLSYLRQSHDPHVAFSANRVDAAFRSDDCAARFAAVGETALVEKGAVVAEEDSSQPY